MSITRRNVLKSVPTCGLVAIVPATAVGVESFDTPISEMYRQWMAITEKDYRELTDDECDARCAAYLELKDRIIAAPPVCARDVAIQFIADTDHSASDFSDAFFDKMMALIAA